MIPTIYNFSSTWNLGDKVCSPNRYFDWLKDAPVKLPWEWTPGPAIFGAGGMLHPGTDHWIAKAVASGEQTAIWGIGLNYHGVQAQLYPKFLDSCALVGMREPGNPWYFVPCPSCMAPEFNEVLTCSPIHKAVSYQHRDYPFACPFPSMTNDSVFFQDVLWFLASAAVVITNTFHGAYWARLLGRKVVLVEPFSNRFLALDGVLLSSRDEILPNVYKALDAPSLAPFSDPHRQINRDWSDKLREYFQE